MPQLTGIRVNKKDLRFNPTVKTLVAAEAFFWSGWSALLPIISIFALEEVSSITLQMITLAYSLYLLLRVGGTFLSSTLLNKATSRVKVRVIVICMLCFNIVYICFLAFHTVESVYFAYALAGLLIGIVQPIKSSLFSTHLDKHKETTEWGLFEGVVLIAVCIVAAISGGLIARYGYTLLFSLFIALNTMSALAYSRLLKIRSL